MRYRGITSTLDLQKSRTARFFPFFARKLLQLKFQRFWFGAPPPDGGFPSAWRVEADSHQ